jgi:hypothetical protein
VVLVVEVNATGVLGTNIEIWHGTLLLALQELRGADGHRTLWWLVPLCGETRILCGVAPSQWLRFAAAAATSVLRSLEIP